MAYDDDDREPLHSEFHRFASHLFALFSGVICLVHPFLALVSLFARNFELAAAAAIQLTMAAIYLRAYLRHDNAVWMTADGIEFGSGPTRVPWRHVGDAIPWLYGAGGFNTLTFTDGTPDVRFFGSADAYKRLERARRAALRRRTGAASGSRS